MSGPKVSVYSVAAARRARIEAERKRKMMELERRSELLEEATAILQELAALRSQLHECDLAASIMCDQMNDCTMQETVAAIDTMIVDLQMQASNTAELKDNKSIEKVLALVSQKREEAQTRVQKVRTEATGLQNKLQEAVDEEISTFFSAASITSPTETNSSDEQSDADSIKLSIREQIDSLLKDKKVSVANKQKLNTILVRLDQIPNESASNFAALEVRPLIKVCERDISVWDTCGAEYHKLLKRYKVLCEMTGTPEDLDLLPLGEEAIVDLKQKIAVLETIAQEQEEQTYIAEVLADVMSEMGYPLIGTRDARKRSGAHFHNSLFRYGEETAVSATFSDDGQIALELGKVDTVDRLPSDAEATSMEYEMVGFCEQFAEIEKRLAERGVVIDHRVQLCSPSTEYAQIINLHDFVVCKNNQAQTQQAKRQKQPAKRLTVSSEE